MNHIGRRRYKSLGELTLGMGCQNIYPIICVYCLVIFFGIHSLHFSIIYYYIICSALFAFHLKFQRYFHRFPRVKYFVSWMCTRDQFHKNELNNCCSSWDSISIYSEQAVHMDALGSAVGSQLKMCSACSTNKSAQLNEAGPQ